VVALAGEHGRQTRVDGQRAGADKRADDQDLAAGHAIGEGGGSDGSDGGDDLVEDVVAELLRNLGDAEVLEDDGVEVTETVTGELAEDGNHEHLGHTPTAVVGKEQRAVCAELVFRGSIPETGGHLQSHGRLSMPSTRIFSFISSTSRSTRRESGLLLP